MFDAPALPHARGPISAWLLSVLRGPAARGPAAGKSFEPLVQGDALDDDDLHLSLYVCYELHHRGWAGIDPEWEWQPDLLRFRRRLEAQFVRVLRAAVTVPVSRSPEGVVSAVRDLLAGDDGVSLAARVEDHGDLEQLQELAIHRSPYQLKEADPHTWAIPRLPPGRAKTALLGLQYDEYGNGERGRSHAELFAETMRALGLDPTYGRYLDVVPGVTLATVNLLSMFGLHRRWVGACLGHLAVFEMTSVIPMSRYANAIRRVTGSDKGAEFYDVHVVADAIHQNVVIDDLLPGLLEDDPTLDNDILFGATTLMLLEARFAEHVNAAWDTGASSLRCSALDTHESIAS